MFFVKNIVKKVYNKVGSLRGKPVTVLSLSMKEDKKLSMDINAVIDKIRELDTEMVVIEGAEIKNNGYLRDLCIGLTRIKKKVNFVTNGSDDIEVIRMHRNILITFDCFPPTKSNPGISKRNLYLMKENDEVKFLINSYTDFEKCLTVLQHNVILRPIVYFVVTNSVSPEDKEEMLKTYLSFYNRIKTDLRLIY